MLSRSSQCYCQTYLTFRSISFLHWSIIQNPLSLCDHSKQNFFYLLNLLSRLYIVRSHSPQLTLMWYNTFGCFDFSTVVSPEDSPLFSLANNLCITVLIKEFVFEVLILLQQVHIILFPIFLIKFVVIKLPLNHDAFNLGLFFMFRLSLRLLRFLDLPTYCRCIFVDDGICLWAPIRQ